LLCVICIRFSYWFIFCKFTLWKISFSCSFVEQCNDQSW
jgi:hypothetical protein